MILDIVSAEYLEGYKIKITFEDSRTGIIDFCVYTKKGGVFEKFKNIEFFKSFRIDR